MVPRFEWKTYQVAVMRQLVLLGYSEAAPGQGAQVAQLRFSRGTFQPERSGSALVSDWADRPAAMVRGRTGDRDQPFAKAAAQVQSDFAGGNPRPSERYRAVGRAGRLLRSFVLAARGNRAGGAKKWLRRCSGLPGQSGETIEVR